MRSLWRVLALALLAAVPVQAAVRFVTPQPGSQVYGPTLIEVETTAKNVDRVEFHIDGKLAAVVRVAPFRYVHDFGESLQGHRITAQVYADGYRTHENAEIATASLSAGEIVDVDLVEVPFRAQTRKGRLHKSDIVVRENGVEQNVLELLSSRGPTTFYFVIDRSLSMRQGKLPRALTAVQRAGKQLRSEDDASVILFNHRVDAPVSIQATENLATRFRGVIPSGGTSLRDALASIQPERRTVAIVISDGADRNSTLDTARALQRVARSKMTVYSLLLGSGAGAEFVEAAAQRSGGTTLRSSAGNLARDLERILADINSRYTAVYQSHGTSKGWREIQLTARAPGIQVAQARRGYYAE
jgi:hypothetical protein